MIVIAGYGVSTGQNAIQFNNQIILNTFLFTANLLLQ